MLLFPTKLDADLTGVPLVTTLVGLACVLIFLVQALSWEEYESALDNFCQNELRGHLKLELPRNDCIDLMAQLDFASDAESQLNKLQQHAPFKRYQRQDILDTFERLQQIVPDPATKQWWLSPTETGPWQIMVASLTHATIGQLALNLGFFFAFAISAELILGHFGFMIFFVAGALFSGWVNYWFVNTISSSQPYLGLTGVVTATMVFITLVYPHKFLRFFFWVIFISGTFRLPLLLVSVGYLSNELYTVGINNGAEANGLARVNVGAHLGGAIIGTLTALGVHCWQILKKRKTQRE